MVEVRQEDREAVRAFHAKALGLAISGNEANRLLAEAFARHRIAAENAAQQEITALDATREDRVAQVVEWLRKENGLCDCHARCETECGCGAWDDWKTKPLLEIADAIERGEPFNG